MDTNVRVLIVDNDKTMLHVLRGLLSQLGFTDIEEALNGSEALEKFNQNDFGLIISEWTMDLLSGFELLKSVRASTRNKTVPFIIVTAESDPKKVMKAKQAGVSNYVVKPFNADTLKKKIESVM